MPDPILTRVLVNELAQFREVQQLAYAYVETVDGMLRPGMTGKDAARLLTEQFGDRGVHDWLYKPLAQFGDRTAFQGFSGLAHMAGFSLAFFPSSRRLEESMPIILNVAPMRNGVIADVGYATCLGENAIFGQLQNDLMTHRELVVRLIRERRSMADVARAVDQLYIKQGVEPRHKAYPFKVLACRMAKLNNPSKPRFVTCFGLNATRSLILDQVRSGKQEGWPPLWSIDRRSKHAPVPGLWVIELHLGFHGVGVKLEELLVVTEDDAYWLDGDLPHVRRQQRRQLAQQRVT